MNQGVPSAAEPRAMMGSPGRLTRADVLGMARGGDAWRALPYCVHVLRLTPDDDEMRCQAAALYARLGLRTAAMELLDTLRDGVKGVAAVVSLRGSVERLGDDRVPVDARRVLCERNLSFVAVEEGLKRSWLGAWLETLSSRECFRTCDGNVVVRPAEGEATRHWVRFRNDALEASRFALPHLAAEMKGVPARGYTIEGVDPPFLFARVARETPRMTDGYQPWIRVVQRDPVEFLDGLSVIDLGDVLASERVRYYVGEGAEARLGEDLAKQYESQIVGPCITLATLRTRCSPSAEQVIAKAAEGQAAEDRSLRERVGRAYVPGVMPVVKDRIRGAASSGRGVQDGERALRVLIPTCRYSTYIKHASSDLAEAFRAAGHEARVLIEPDDHSRFSSVAYLRALETFAPDLVVLINYTRSQLAGVFPPGLAFVSWYQDAMPSQFSTEVGRALGENDYLIGHLHPELFSQFEYPEARCASMPMVVSTAKFHAGSVDTEREQEYSCEVAYVSHHSETPEQMHARLMREAGAGTLAAQVFERLRGRVREIAMGCGVKAGYAALREAAANEISAALVNDPAGRSLTQVFRQYCLPLADRIVRHQTLEWAARICERRGWRLHVYGRGWEQSESFAKYARGELPHDEALRAAYQCAALHLHMTINTPVHQRVMEGAMSGGLVACRLHRDAIDTLIGDMQDAAMEEADADRSTEFVGLPGYAIADSPGAMSVMSQLQRLGAAPEARRPGWVFVSPEMLAGRSSAARRHVRAAARLQDLVGELSDITFRGEADLERLIERAVSDPGWRRMRSRSIADRVRAGMTHDVLVERILRLVGADAGA